MNQLKSKIIYTLGVLFPNNFWETFIFLFFCVVYGTMGAFIALDYRIIFDDRIPWDAYFSFDNRAIVMTGGGFERHPLSNYFFDYVRDFALWVSGGKKNEIFRLTLAWLSTITISLCLVQVYKYLKNIIGLRTLQTFLLVIFFAFFSTNILLSFTPETYTYSLFLLTAFNYYSAKKIQQGKDIPFIPLMLSGIAIGGLTITNIVKTYIPILFEKNLFRSWKKFWLTALKVGASAVVFILLFLNRVNFDFTKIITKTGEQYEKFSNPKVVPIWDMIVSWFFGGNILFAGFIERNYHNKKGFEYKALFMDTYSGGGAYLFVGILLGLIVWAYIKNLKKPEVQILALSFLVDIIIHCLLKFGLHTSYIYGGHFVFVYPFLLGWLLYYYRENNEFSWGLSGLILIMSVYLAFNNISQMAEFFEFLEKYYK